MSNTPFMNLSLPTPTITIGPLWASMINTALNLVDSHDHTASKGSRIPTAALNINANLDFGSYSVFNAKSLRLAVQSSTLTGASNANGLFSLNGNLYFTNGSGVPVQLTSGASVAAAPGAASVLDYTSTNIDLILIPADTFVVVGVDTSALRTITLPLVSAVSVGRLFVIKDIVGSALDNPITIAASGADTVEGDPTLQLDSNFGSVFLISDGGTNWKQI